MKDKVSLKLEEVKAYYDKTNKLLQNLHTAPSKDTIIMFNDLKEEIRKALDGKEKNFNMIMDIKHQLNEQDRRSQEHREQQDKKQEAILLEAKKTNGRISDLEKWKWLTIGGLTVISAIVIPLFLKLF